MAYRKPPRELLEGLSMTPGVSHKERNRLLALFFVMAVVTAALLGGLDRFLGGMRRRLPTAEVVIPGEAESRPSPLVEIPETIPWTADPGFVEARIKEKTPEDRVTESPEALLKLAELVRLRPHAHFLLDPELRAERGFLTPDPADVLATPSKYRVRPVEFTGELVFAERVDTKAEFSVDVNFQYATQWTGMLKVASAKGDDRFVSFLGLDDGVEDLDRLVGRRVKLQGVFYRLRDVRAEGEMRTTAFVLAKKIVRALTVPATKELPADFAATIDDSARESQLVVYDDAFYRVFGYVFSNPPERVLGVDPPRAIASRDGWDRADDLRLKPVRIKGRVVQVRYEPFEYGNESFQLVRQSDAMATGWYTVYVASHDAEGLYVVGMKDRPVGCEEGADVEVDAIYFRRLLFKNRGSAHPADAPPNFDPSRHGLTRASVVFAPRQPVLLRPPAREIDAAFEWKILGVGAAVSLVLAIMVIRDRARVRRASEALRKHRGERLRTLGVDLTAVARRTFGGAKDGAG